MYIVIECIPKSENIVNCISLPEADDRNVYKYIIRKLIAKAIWLEKTHVTLTSYQPLYLRFCHIFAFLPEMGNALISYINQHTSKQILAPKVEHDLRTLLISHDTFRAYTCIMVNGIAIKFEPDSNKPFTNVPHVRDCHFFQVIFVNLFNSFCFFLRTNQTCHKTNEHSGY